MGFPISCGSILSSFVFLIFIKHKFSFLSLKGGNVCSETVEDGVVEIEYKYVMIRLTTRLYKVLIFTLFVPL